MASDVAWSGPPQHLGAGVVLLDADSARILFLVLGAYVRSEAARNGGTALSSQLRAIDVVLRSAMKAGASPGGHADVRIEVEPSALAAPDLIRTREVAEMLNVSDRQARRLARAGAFGHVHDRGRDLLVSRAEVQAEADARRAG